jgi:hypothetical protein
MAVRLATRVTNLERRVGILQVADKRHTSKKSRTEKIWEIIQPFLVTLIPSLVLFWIGYSFQEQVKRDIEERKLRTDNVKEMRELIRQLLVEDLDTSKAHATAIAIAAFGRYSVVPLVSILETGGVNRTLAAQRGLVAAGLADRSHTCAVLVEILDNRTQRYTTITHRQIIRTVSEVGCMGSEGAHGERALERYRTFLDAGAASVGDALVDGNEPDAVLRLQAELSSARKRLGLDKEHTHAASSTN